MSDDFAPKVAVELCVGSVADAERAVIAGADRLELCAALELGGLTPPPGLLETALQAAVAPVMCMLRPRAGGFRYDQHEFAAMLRDAQWIVDAGAAGVVFGILDEHGRIDVPRCRDLLGIARGAQTVFHRAFDFIAEQRAALTTLIELGVTRVLTSGGRSSAAEGATMIRTLMDQAAGQIEILPGGGIRAENVVEIVRSTGCSQIHIGAAAPFHDGSIAEPARIELIDRRYVQGSAYRGVSSEAVTDVVAALRSQIPRR